MRCKPFLTAYTLGEPVAVTVIQAGLRGVVGLLILKGGVYFLDDGCLDALPTHHADHFVRGITYARDGELIISNHRFHSLSGPQAEHWQTMFAGIDLPAARRSAENRLRELLNYQC